MKRRNFLKSMLYSGAAVGPLSGLILPGRNAFAAGYGNTTQRTLINTMLLGGADLRYLFVPPPGTAYAEKFWQARKQLYAGFNSYDMVWQNLYDPVLASDGSEFGIHKNAGWLKQLYDARMVAIVANVVASTNRRHDHSQLIMHTGNLGASQYLLDTDGWGGRLVSAIPDVNNKNVVAISHDVSIYCNSLNLGNRLDHAIHMRDSRNFTLPGPDPYDLTSPRSIMARALKAYYAKRGEEIEQQILNEQLPQDWPYRRFFQHEAGIRAFGDSFAARLQDVLPVQPEILTRLSQEGGEFKLNNTTYGKQIASTYDALLGADLLNLRSIYMEYTGWDSHREEQTSLQGKFHDLFGLNGGLNSLAQMLTQTPGMAENMVLTFTTDFGRQLAANGTNGTDHGTGNYMIVLGIPVNGGTYGEMFPQREVTPDENQQIPFETQGADIKGLTSFERVLAEVCDWIEPGSGVKVFPNMENAGSLTGPILEPGVDLGVLFKPGYFLTGKISVAKVDPYTYQNMQVTISGPNNFNATVPVDGNGIYRLGPVSDGTYVVTPHKDYYSFTPPQASYQIAGGNIDDADFSADPQLHLISAAKQNKVYEAPDGTPFRYLQAMGYNLVPDQTVVKLAGLPLFTVVSGSYVFAAVPVAMTSGEIVVTTPAETYTHPVLYEDLPFV